VVFLSLEMSKKLKSNTIKVGSTLAKSEDGTIQITFTIPFKLIEDKKELALKEIGKSIDIPGFRKGMAPVTKIEEKVTKETLYEKILNQILPQELSTAYSEYKIKPVIYPKLELISSNENEDWQVRVTTCELPEIELGDYKKAIEATKTQKIWTPQEKESKDKQTELTHEQKEQQVIKTLLEISKTKIPKPLIEGDVNSRLSRLLEQIEKLGLTFESYLSSIGKTIEALRSEYEKQAADSLTLELSLNKIAQNENVEIKEEEIDAVIKASTAADPQLEEKFNNPEQRKAIAAVLKRREALNQLVKLIP
jgi:FKBP-type peptidyl-prolyl cis-trans isomerase (trigger factor)